MTRISALVLLGACLFSVPAFAQMGMNTGGMGGGMVGGAGGGMGPTMGGGGMGAGGGGQRGGQGGDDNSGGGKPDDKPVPPPAAIPGAQPNADAAVIPASRLAAEMSPNDALFDAINRGDLAAAKDALSRGAQLDAHNVLGQTPTDAAIDLSRNDITFLLLSMRSAVSTGHPVRTASDAPVKTKVVKASTAPRPVIVDRGTPNPAVGFTGF